MLDRMLELGLLVASVFFLFFSVGSWRMLGGRQRWNILVAEIFFSFLFCLFVSQGFTDLFKFYKPGYEWYSVR